MSTETQTGDRRGVRAARRRSAPRATRSPSPTTAPARPTSCRSPTAPCARWTCARSRSTRTNFGLMSYDPAYMNTASCRSAITYIDGDAGILQHRGYPIEQLCEHSSYLEVAYLLINGALPTAGAARGLGRRDHDPHVRARERQGLHAGLPLRRQPDGDARRLGRARCRPSTRTPTRSTTSDVRAIQIIRLLAKMPTLAAFAFRHNMGQPYVYPDNDLAYAGNFLGMMYKMTELKYQPDPRLARALDVLFILHADHEQNASTSAVRSVGSTQVDPYSAVAAGRRGALRAAARRRQRAGAADARADREAWRTSPPSWRA